MTLANNIRAGDLLTIQRLKRKNGVQTTMEKKMLRLRSSMVQMIPQAMPVAIGDKARNVPMAVDAPLPPLKPM